MGMIIDPHRFVVAEPEQLAKWDLTVPSTTVTPQAASTEHADVTAGTFKPILDGSPSASTNATTGMAFSGTGDNGYLGTNKIGTDVPGDDYWEFTIAADSGSIDFDKLILDTIAPTWTGTKAVTWEVRSSVDSYASAVGSHTENVSGGTDTGVEIDLSSMGTQSGTITIRVYNYADSTGFSGQMRVDNVEVWGTLV